VSETAQLELKSGRVQAPAPRYAHAAVIGGADNTTLFIHGGYNLDGGPGAGAYTRPLLSST